MTMHAAIKLQEQLRQETSPDVLTSLMRLAQAVADSLLYMLSRCKQDARGQPNGAHLKHIPAQLMGQASLIKVSDVASCAQQLFAAAEGASSLHQHSALLGQLAQSICQVAAAAHSLAGEQLPRSFSVTAAAALQKLLAHALEVLSQPPKEIFSNIGGAPEAASEDIQGAAKRWQHDSAALLRVVTELLSTLASFGSLQLAHARHGGESPADGRAATEQDATARSFWDAVKLANDNSKNPQAQEPNGHPRGVDAISEQMSSTAIGKKTGGEQPYSKPASRKLLIEELGTGHSSKRFSAGDQVPSREQAATLGRGGVIIEEIDDDISESAADVSEADIQALTASEITGVLLVCALHSSDQRLDAPWASVGTDSAAASTLECLASHLSTGRQRQKDTRGDQGIPHRNVIVPLECMPSCTAMY